LSPNLSDKDFTEVLNNEILRLGDDKIKEDLVIAIDPGDIMSLMPRPWNSFAVFMMAVSRKWPGDTPCAG